MPNWYDREENALVEQFNNGQISRKEFDEAMRELNQELRAQAQEAADEAYDNAMGGW